jgi:hypothetical protein
VINCSEQKIDESNEYNAYDLVQWAEKSEETLKELDGYNFCGQIQDAVVIIVVDAVVVNVVVTIEHIEDGVGQEMDIVRHEEEVLVEEIHGVDDESWELVLAKCIVLNEEGRGWTKAEANRLRYVIVFATRKRRAQPSQR